MNIWKKPWFIPIVLTILIVVAGQLYTDGKLTKAETLPKQEISSQLAEIYDGEVKDLILDGSVYKAKVSRAGAEYAVEVDAESGKVISLIQTKESTKPEIVMGTDDGKEAPADETSPNETPGKVTEEADAKAADRKAADQAASKTEEPKPNVNKTPEQSKPAKQEKRQNTAFISEQQAEKIALAQLPSGMIGEIDDVDFEKSTDGGYYLVQIEIDTDDDMDEVTYQIHAISGKVMTVTWDD
ncbi:PepSY domain-containing protein [Sporosarcina koreensis]|uniref:PepSY domain-containing protein n=1 Tax=Bacillales TaxID=1385 RepID=UPI00075E1E54|nr:PepSY domain-containing protein [Sporosarcina koreensis]